MQFSLIFVLMGVLMVYGAQDAKTRRKIVGGEITTIEEFPYTVSIRINNRHFCGGAIITNQHVLTAAHCLQKFRGGSIKGSLVAGTNSKLHDDGGTEYDLKTIVSHVGYNNVTTVDDIGIIVVSKPFEFNSKIQSIELAPSDMDFPTGALAVVAGYGQTQQTVDTQYLRKVSLPFVDQKQCEEAYQRIAKQITNTMLCTGFSEGGKDSCQGDSGGSLIYENKIAGVVSFGYGCGVASYPGVYTDVRKYIDWINYVVDKTSESNEEKTSE